MNPPKGDGEWARKSLFKIIFYYQKLQYQNTYIIPLGSYTKLTQELTREKVKDFRKWGDPRGVLDGPKVTFRTAPLSHAPICKTFLCFKKHYAIFYVKFFN